MRKLLSILGMGVLALTLAGCHCCKKSCDHHSAVEETTTTTTTTVQ